MQILLGLSGCVTHSSTALINVHISGDLVGKRKTIKIGLPYLKGFPNYILTGKGGEGEQSETYYPLGAKTAL